ncbi:MFS transporter [Vibrio maerlii]|uniref:MFS transporter n=1 Tax=Vibrio maerlii TaxID=2231648 RepID=UPI000E3C10F8|nr:MFS transporter [Vibrio maerlii]
MNRLSHTTIAALLGVFLIALNLRAPFTSLAPLLEQIMQDLSMSASLGGFVTALPLVALALFSPIAPKLSSKVGINSALLAAVILIGIGIAIRSVGFALPLYIGTVLLGAGVAFGNVLLPAFVKEHFPNHISLVTSSYIFLMGIGSTLAASLMIPLSHSPAIAGVGGWQLALLFNLIFVLVALLYWLPKWRQGRKTVYANSTESRNASPLSLIRSKVAWIVTLALGINSFTFYSFAGWLPKILTDYGYSELDAGYIYSFLQFSTMVPGLILMPVLAKWKNHVALVSICSGSVVISLIGLLTLPQFATFWVAYFGLSNCSTFIVVLSFIGLRTNNASQAAALSGMSQSIGYAFAATGPSLVGWSHTVTGGWQLPIGIITVFAFFCLICAANAARDRKV